MHKAKKSLGQNFLNDQNIIHNIISQAHIKADDYVIEIGPGLGALTSHILPITKELHVIEYDADVIPFLKAKCTNIGKLHILEQDVLTVDFTQFQQTKKIKLIGNLPYNISSPILFHLITYKHLFKDMHFMLQKEVVNRIIATPNNKNYGRLSVMLQYHFDCQGLFDVPPSAFSPQPKVDSKIIRLTPYKTLPCLAKDYKLFANLVKHTYNQRRKTLRNTIKTLAPQIIDSIDIPVNLNLRPENLSVEDFASLANFITDNS